MNYIDIATFKQKIAVPDKSAKCYLMVILTQNQLNSSGVTMRGFLNAFDNAVNTSGNLTTYIVYPTNFDDLAANDKATLTKYNPGNYDPFYTFIDQSGSPYGITQSGVCTDTDLLKLFKAIFP